MDLFNDQKHRSHSRRSLTLTSCDIVELVQEKTVERRVREKQRGIYLEARVSNLYNQNEPFLAPIPRQ